LKSAKIRHGKEMQLICLLPILINWKNDSATVYFKMAKSLSDSLSVEERKSLLAFQDVVVDEQAKLEKLEKEKIETREKSRIYLLMSGIVVFIVIILLLIKITG
jgi:hypothetical protein